MKRNCRVQWKKVNMDWATCCLIPSSQSNPNPVLFFCPSPAVVLMRAQAKSQKHHNFHQKPSKDLLRCLILSHLSLRLNSILIFFKLFNCLSYKREFYRSCKFVLHLSSLCCFPKGELIVWAVIYWNSVLLPDGTFHKLWLTSVSLLPNSKCEQLSLKSSP